MQMNKLFGLVLTGGKSSRMGTDKASINYHKEPQSKYLYKLLEQVCDRTFYSIGDKQQIVDYPDEKCIVDLNEYRGPLNGILSAHKAHPDAGWLVLACDLPLIDLENLKLLKKERDTQKTATAMATHKTKLPEPLVAIWEPKGLKEAIAYMEAAQSSCPRKYLINSDTKLVFPIHDKVLFNANTLAEYEHAKSILANESI